VCSCERIQKHTDTTYILGKSDTISRIDETKNAKLKATYAEAEALLENGNNVHAAMVFGSLDDYEDAQGRSEALWDVVSPRSTISAGSTYTMGLKADGTVAVAGNRVDTADNWEDIISISAGRTHVVGLKSNGTVVAAGSVGDGRGNVSNWSGIVVIAAGAYHTVGLKSDGTAVAVGDNGIGQCNVSGWTDIKLPTVHMGG
jgi:hypothetical protein